MTAARGLAFFVALLFLLASLSAEAKKKKAAKKHKTPAASTKSKSKAGAPPADESESDDESDEKSSSKKAAPEADEEKKAPPPAPEPEDQPMKKAPPKAAKAPKDEEASGEGALVALQFGLGGAALFRQIAWTQDLGMLAPYKLAPGPEAAAWLETYPAAFVTDGFAANIGLYGNFHYGFGASSKTPPPSNQTLTTKYQDFLAGLKIRFPVGSFVPYVAVAYGMQKFALDPAAMDRPNFNYTVAHLGAGARIYFTPSIDADVSAGYLLVLGLGKAAGEVASPALYPDAAAYGIDAALSIGFRLVSMIGVRVGVDFRQMGISLHWKMNQPGIKAGGAVDRYVAAWGGLEVVFDALGGGSGHDEAVPAKKAPKAKKASDGEPGEPGEPEVKSKDENPADVE